VAAVGVAAARQANGAPGPAQPPARRRQQGPGAAGSGVEAQRGWARLAMKVAPGHAGGRGGRSHMLASPSLHPSPRICRPPPASSSPSIPPRAVVVARRQSIRTPCPCGDSFAQAGAGPGPPKVAGGDSRRHSGDDEPAARTPGIPALHQARAGSRRFAFTIARGRPAVRARSSTSFPTFRPAEQMLPRCCSFSHRLIHIGGQYVETRRQIRFEGS